MSYKWNYFGEMLRRPNLSVHVPLASSVWQGRDLHCLNLSKQLIGVAVPMQFCHWGFPARSLLCWPGSTARCLPGDTSLPQTELLVSFALRRACARTLFVGFVQSRG